jgi:hypothetical protein
MATKRFEVSAEETEDEDEDTAQPVPLQPAEDTRGQDEDQALPLDPASAAAHEGAQRLLCHTVCPGMFDGDATCNPSHMCNEVPCSTPSCVPMCSCSLCRLLQAPLLLQNLCHMPFQVRW